MPGMPQNSGCLSWAAAQLVERSPIMHEALGSVPSTTHTTYNVDLIAQSCNPNTREVEAGGSEVQGQPQLHTESDASLDYTDPVLEKPGG